MLCYRSQKEISNVVRDAISWLALNRRMMSMLLWPIMLVSLIAYIMLRGTIYDLINNQLLEELHMPFGFCHEARDTNTAALAYGMMAGIMTFIMVPMLMRYFVDRKSLQHLQWHSAYSIIKEHRTQALITALAVTIGTIVMCHADWVIGLLMSMILTVVVPCIYMHGQYGKRQRMKALRLIWAYVMIWLMCYVISAIPAFFEDLILIALKFFDTVVPGFIADTTSLNTILLKIIAYLSCVSFCGAVVYFNTAALLLHGLIITKRQ